MGNLAGRIKDEKVDSGCLAIYWLAQAGFVFKSSSGRIVYIDPYFSEAVERAVGFKRMMVCPIAPEEVVADLVVCTHEHLDHMDADALPIIVKNLRTHFAGPIECVKEFRKMGIAKENCHLLEEGKTVTLGRVGVSAVYADHGELAPGALGIVFDFDGIKVYHTGDTASRPERFQRAIEMKPDVLIPCINGRYGNMDGREAALLAASCQPRVVIASHFWMFVEHNGDPASFLEHCSKLAPDVQALVMKPGERFLFEKSRNENVL